MTMRSDQLSIDTVELGVISDRIVRATLYWHARCASLGVILRKEHYSVYTRNGLRPFWCLPFLHFHDLDSAVEAMCDLAEHPDYEAWDFGSGRREVEAQQNSNSLLNACWRVSEERKSCEEYATRDFERLFWCRLDERIH